LRTRLRLCYPRHAPRLPLFSSVRGSSLPSSTLLMLVSVVLTEGRAARGLKQPVRCWAAGLACGDMATEDAACGGGRLLPTLWCWLAGGLHAFLLPSPRRCRLATLRYTTCVGRKAHRSCPPLRCWHSAVRGGGGMLPFLAGGDTGMLAPWRGDTALPAIPSLLHLRAYFLLPVLHASTASARLPGVVDALGGHGDLRRWRLVGRRWARAERLRSSLLQALPCRTATSPFTVFIRSRAGGDVGSNIPSILPGHLFPVARIVSCRDRGGRVALYSAQHRCVPTFPYAFSHARTCIPPNFSAWRWRGWPPLGTAWRLPWRHFRREGTGRDERHRADVDG